MSSSINCSTSFAIRNLLRYLGPRLSALPLDGVEVAATPYSVSHILSLPIGCLNDGATAFTAGVANISHDKVLSGSSPRPALIKHTGAFSNGLLCAF